MNPLYRLMARFQTKLSTISFVNRLVKSLLWALCVLTLAWPSRPGQGSAGLVVGLMYLDAEVVNGQVELEWQLAFESNYSGFFVQRGPLESGPFEDISPFIPTEGGDVLTGSTYTYTDANVESGTTYWYRLKILDQGQAEDFSEEVVSVQIPEEGDPTASATSTETGSATTTTQGTPSSPGAATATSTATLAPTRTATQAATATRALTATLRPNATSTVMPPQPPTATATQYINPLALTPTLPGPTETVTSTATATLLPFPTITIEFPAVTPPATLLFIDRSADPQEPGFPKSGRGSGSPGLARFWPLALLVLFWLALGGWFLYVQRFAQKLE